MPPSFERACEEKRFAANYGSFWRATLQQAKDPWTRMGVRRVGSASVSPSHVG